MLNSGYSLGSFAGPLLSGYLTEKYEFAWATTIMTLTLLAMVISRDGRYQYFDVNANSICKALIYQYIAIFITV